MKITFYSLKQLEQWDAVCQRGETPMAQRIAEDFDPDKFRPIDIFHQDGTTYVVDGRQRTTGLRLMGSSDDFQVPCIDHGELSTKRAAEIFKGLNDFIRLRKFNTFMADYLEGKHDQCTIVEIVENLELRIVPGGQTGGIQAVDALEWVLRPTKRSEPDAEALRRTLQIIVAAWGPTKYALQGQIIRGIGRVVLRDKERLDDAYMARKLAGRDGGPAKLLADAHAEKKLLGGQVGTCVADQAILVYNHGRRARDRMLKPFRS